MQSLRLGFENHSEPGRLVLLDNVRSCINGYIHQLGVLVRQIITQ